MKKILMGLGVLVLASCASNNVQEGRSPAQTSNVGTFSAKAGKVGDQAVICKAVCEIFIPNKFNDPKDQLQLGNYSVGQTVIVSNAASQEAALGMLKDKCSDASPEYNLYKSLGVDLSVPADSIYDKVVSYRPSDILTSSNASEFCSKGEVTDFINYATYKTANPLGMNMKTTHRNP